MDGINAIRRWLAPPIFEGDEEKTRQAMLINLIGIMCIAFTLVVMAGALFGRNTPTSTLIIDLVACAMILQFLRWLRNGRVTLARAGLVIFGLVYITGVTASIGTIRTPTAAIFVFWVVMTGLLFDLRGILMGTIAASLAVWGLIVAENAGWLRHPFQGVGVTQWVTFTALFGFTSGLTYYIIQGTKRSLSRAEKEIEERKQAEQALSKSKQQYDDLVSKIPFGTYILSSKQNGSFALDYVSPRAAELFNASVQSLLADAKLVFQTIHPDDRDTFIKLNQEGIEQLRPFEWSGRFQSDGQIKFLHIGSSPDPQANGDVLWHGIVEDITERKKTEQLLQESEAHLQAIFNNEPECIKVIDAQGRLFQMNPAGLAMIEADSLAQVKGASVLGLIASDYRESFMDMHKRVIAGQAGKMEFELIGLQGGRRWVETHAAPMKTRGETVHLAITRDITQRKQMEDQVRQLAFYDVVTDLPNRRLLLDRLNRAINASKRTGRYGAVVFLDLDNFKSLNDTHGHEAGDLLLIEVARRLTGSVREIDTVSRFGGDEFAVLLSELTADKAESTKEVGIIAEKIRIQLAEPYLLAIRRGGNTLTTLEHRCSASIGAVVFMSHECSQEDILRRADTAMYQAKDAGRNAVIFHEASDEV
jgi:diguanylate cyclase (GGDEF)-like protein/PAS domain S-box-containing protein